MSDFLFVPLRPFFYAALTKRWKVQFHKGLRKFNNVDSKTTYFNENCCIIYIYIYYTTDESKRVTKDWLFGYLTKTNLNFILFYEYCLRYICIYINVYFHVNRSPFYYHAIVGSTIYVLYIYLNVLHQQN